MSEDLIAPLIDEIEKTKEKILKGNFKIMIRLGLLAPEYIHKFINDNPEAKKAVDDAVEKYREMCWERYEDDDPDYCDKVRPMVDVVVYAIPEEKSIMVKVVVDEIGEVYRVTNKYENADDFFKALKGYDGVVIYFW
jgi:KaiC/GvpD/RAD55 family RecA-like ATPase